jgi:hypothetical protein
METRKLVESGDLNGFDVIIGPLYADEVQIISEFSLSEQVIVINPLSSNSEIIKQNPFAMMFRATVERESEEAARYVAANLQENKNYFIFYGPGTRDSISTAAYYSVLEKDSFDLNFFHRISSYDTVDIYKTLTRKIKLKDLNLDPDDSLRLLSHYTFDLEALEEAEKKIEDQEIFIMHPDSIGHVFGASSNELIATSIISGVETRADNTLIVGNEDWLSIRQLSLEQLDRLNIILTAPGFIDLGNRNLGRINRLIIDKTHAPPNKYHYLGYEIISYLGYMLNKYGSPYLMGLKSEGFYRGLIFHGFDYTHGQDNNIVPIIQFVEDDFVIINNPSGK